jgi:hypothetical protein
MSLPSSQLVWLPLSQVIPYEVLKDKHLPLLLTCLEQGNKTRISPRGDS